MLLQGKYIYPRQSSRELRDSTHTVQVNCILLSKEQYLFNIHFHITVPFTYSSFKQSPFFKF